MSKAIPTDAMIEAAAKVLNERLAKEDGLFGVSREMLSAALSAGQAQPVVNWDDPEDPAVNLFVGYDVEDYVEEYEFRGDEGDYTPNEAEKGLLIDAIYGVVADLHEKLRALPAPARPPVQVPVVKALTWDHNGPSELYGSNGFSSHYVITMAGKWKYLLTFPVDELEGQYFATFAEAKAAAQSDYEARIRSALTQAVDVKGETEGWRRVPTEATVDMVDAWEEAYAKAPEGSGHVWAWEDAYRAMIAASPEQGEKDV